QQHQHQGQLPISQDEGPSITSIGQSDPPPLPSPSPSPAASPANGPVYSPIASASPSAFHSFPSQFPAPAPASGNYNPIFQLYNSQFPAANSNQPSSLSPSFSSS